MSEGLIVVLAVFLLVLWSRLSELRNRVAELEKALARLRSERNSRSEAQVPTSAPGPGTAPSSSPSSAPAPPPPAVSIPELARQFEPPRPVAARVQVSSTAAAASQAAHAGTSLWDAPPLSWIRHYFTGGNVVVRVGIIVLFFGVGFLLKYAVERTQISIQYRLWAAAVGALVLFVLGWRLRHRRRGFSLSLQGGAVGILYLILYAALHLYHLLDPGVAFALMAGLGIASLLLANSQDSLALAMLGAIGGYLAPLLASTGEGNHVVLFGYYALLTLAVVAQAWFRAWRPLNLLAFLFVFGVGTAWGVLRYEPVMYASTQPFLVFFFLAFVAIAVLFAMRRAPDLAHYVDGTLVFGTPLIVMTLQLQLVRDVPHGRPVSALLAALVYLAVAAWLYLAHLDRLKYLREAFLAIGVALFTLAVPLALDDSWTTAAWALEGAGLYWTGARQRHALARTAGLALQLVAGWLFITQVAGSGSAMPVANAACIGALFLAVAGLASARIAVRYGRQPRVFDNFIGEAFSGAFLAWGLCWWLYAAGHEMRRFLAPEILPGALLGLFAVTALVSGFLARRTQWPGLRSAALLIVPVLVVAAAWWLHDAEHPGSRAGWLAWPLALVTCGLVLRWHQASLSSGLAATVNVVTLWLGCLLLGVEIGWWIGELTGQGSAWSRAAWALVPIATLAILSRTERFVGPMRNWGGAGIAAALVVWLVWFNLRSDGSAAPVPYLPFMNPLDIAVALALWVMARWLIGAWRMEERTFTREALGWMTGALVMLVFGWLNGVLLRTMHHWRHVPWESDVLLRDTAVQSALSIFWTALALGAMLWANRSGRRIVWFGAAALMAVVVVKLFLVDLSGTGTVARIVSFLGVGALMLVIGYFSPLPPARDHKSQFSPT